MTPPALPTVSVIVPIYNVADHVAACIASLRAQTFADFEVIAVDDGSTDDSGERARAAIGDDPRFRVIQRENGGLSAARNTGLDAARGDFIAFVDSDDRVHPDYLARLHRAVTETGADWAACAIRFCYPDGTEAVHSGLHGRPDPGAGPEFWPLDDWREAIRPFPSAWNKLYRRDLIGDLRFAEGTYFEDHAFYQRLVARSDRLLLLPEPLYLQTRMRPGQITGEDSERVFEQFSVLEHCAQLLADGPGKHHGAEAFGRLACRLLFERSTALRDPGRRARFARAAAEFLDRHGLRYDTGWDRDLSPAWGREMAGELPLSVVIPWNGEAGALRDSLHALALPPMMGREIVIVCDSACPAARPDRAAALAEAAGLPAVRVLAATEAGPGPARNTGLAAARGLFVVFLDAGDRPAPHTLLRWCDAMLREEAEFGVSAFHMGTGGQAALHGGFHDMAEAADLLPDGAFAFSPAQALALHCLPSAKIFSRAFLNRHGLAFGPGALADWPIGIGAALISPRSLYFPWPGMDICEAPACRRLWHALVPARVLARTVAALPRHLPGPAAAALPAGWQARLLTRALWEKLHFAPMRGLARLWFRIGAARVLLSCPRPPAGARLDPYMDPSRLLRLSGLRQ